MARETTQKIGFGIEATPETDPIDAEGALYWQFGIRPYTFNDLHPIETHDWLPIYQGGSRMPNDFQLIEEPLSLGIAFYPTTTVADYLMLGACITDNSDIHTITNIDSGALPTFTVRSEMSGGTAARYVSAVGCKANLLSGHLICHEGWGYFSNTLGYTGIKTQTASRNGSTTGPYYQTSDGVMTAANQLKNRYHRNDGTFVFTWDAVDYKADLAIFNYQVVSGLNAFAVSGQSETEYIDEGMYNVMLSGSLWRGSDHQIYDDFLANTKTHDIVFKIYAGSTNYATRTFSNIALTHCEAPYAEGTKEKWWNFRGLAKDYGVVSLDGITDGVGDAVFYGE